MSADDNSPAEVLAPVEQDTVPFYGHELVAVRLADERICAVLGWLCEGLGVNEQSQLRHIRGRAVLVDGLVTVRVQTEGGPQPMPALTMDVLPGWLFTIDERRFRPEAQPDVMVFQRECAGVRAEHFARRQPQLSAPSSLVPSEPITHPTVPDTGAPPAEWLDYHKAMVAWIEWQRDIEGWRQHIDTRLDQHEQVLQLVPEILQRLGPETLSPAHQQTVHPMVKRLHHLPGHAYPTLWTQLGASFHVAKYDQIPEARWGEVAEWLRTRITRAGGQMPEQGTMW